MDSRVYGKRPPDAQRRAAAMSGILKLAYKLLVNDKAKFTALLVGVTFAVFLMTAMTSMFASRKAS